MATSIYLRLALKTLEGGTLALFTFASSSRIEPGTQEVCNEHLSCLKKITVPQVKNRQLMRWLV